ncbi:MAG: lytic transglycosylase domain-containing protein [Gammaproteobacteria bacterium]
MLEIEPPSRAAGEEERTGVAIIRKLAKKAEHPQEPPTPSRLARLIDRLAKEHGLEPALLDAVIRVESAYQPNATSPKGAMGLMQLMPATARRFGVHDPYDAEDNIRGGARYLRWLLDKFGDVELALAGYNAGEGAVVDWGGIPPYRETRRYVPRVLQAYRRERRWPVP